MSVAARRSAPRLEELDGRIVPSVALFARGNAGTAGVTTSLAAFEGDIGGVNNGGGPAATTGFRTINWDGVGLGATDGAFTNEVITPNHTVGIPVDRFQSRGVVFEDIYAVTDEGFATENPGAAGQFTPFSAPKTFAMFNDNGIELHFTVPGSTAPAATLGFGAVFLDVEKANTTSIEYFNGTTSLGKLFVPVAPSGQPSFLGATFAEAVVTRVEITLGDATLFSFDGSTVTPGPADLSNGGTADLVATDDFVYAEPRAYSAPPNGQAVVASGPTNGTAAVLTSTPPTHFEGPLTSNNNTLVVVPGVTTTFTPTPTATLKPFGNIAANVRTAAADVDGDGIADTVLITGPGVPVRFAVVSGKDNSTLLVPPTAPFAGSESFTGGGYVAAADLDGDGKAELLISPDQGGGPRVVVFSAGAAGASPTVRASFFGIDDPPFRGGARVAVGDVNHDGRPDLAVAAGFLGGPRVAVFDGTTVLGAPKRLVGDFFAFPGSDAVNLRNGAFVALGDVDGDGFADVIAGGGPGGAPRVLTISGQMLLGSGGSSAAQAAPLMNFFVAGNSADRGGVRVTALNADGDGKADVALGSGEGSPSKVRVYLGADVTNAAEPTTFQNLDPFGTTLAGGVFVG